MRVLKRVAVAVLSTILGEPAYITADPLIKLKDLSILIHISVKLCQTDEFCRSFYIYFIIGCHI